MRSSRAIIIVLALVGLFFQRSVSQCQPFHATATYIDADIINAASLVDPLAEKIKDLPASTFSLFIGNPTDSTIWVTIGVSAYVTLDDEKVTKSIFTGPVVSTPFEVPIGGRVFRSVDANNSSDISFGHIPIDEDVKTDLKNRVTNASSGGKVPSGRYEVKLALTVVKVGTTPTNCPVDISPSSDIIVNVTNPTNATLIFPPDNGYEYPTSFPQFQWTADVSSIRLSVYEKRPEQQSLEDAITASDPYLVVSISRDPAGYLLSSFTYPQSAAGSPTVQFLNGPRPLERGKMYVAVLDGIRTAFGYDVQPLRTIRSFRIADPQGQMILNVLQNFLAGGPFEDIFGTIHDQNLQINASGIILNGVPISLEELQVLLNQNKNNIKSIRFEDQ